MHLKNYYQIRLDPIYLRFLPIWKNGFENSPYSIFWVAKGIHEELCDTLRDLKLNKSGINAR
jgi:hypothetical protein